MKSPQVGRQSAFKAQGFRKTLELLAENVQALYLSDEIPWVVGYSGGKDSTATLQLIWTAIAALPAEKRTKVIHVISTDTLVENPIIAGWVNASLLTMQRSASDQDLPFRPNRLLPELKDRFWVNMIGRGYPAPRPKFRWCTERLKINPSNNFIRNVVDDAGEVILALGTRKAESQVRSASIDHYSKNARAGLQRHGQLDRSWVFSPIVDWSNDDVWQYLMQVKNPWGIDNKDLLGMYQGATEDGECPLVVDTSTPSCGDSRFGCYVCTMVTEDKSMRSMIANDSDKAWMLPLLQFRNQYLGNLNDRNVREFKRLNGSLMVHNDRLVHGPYTQSYRVNMLRALLETQLTVNKHLPKGIDSLELITIEELREIRRIWIEDKHEVEDLLPAVYEDTLKRPFSANSVSVVPLLRTSEIETLREISDGQTVESRLHYELLRELITTQAVSKSTHSRAKLLDELDRVLERSAFADADEALSVALSRRGMSASEDSGLGGQDMPSLFVNITLPEQNDVS
ncbi:MULTISPECIES: DNA phosphorothioation system sulfurtransferase DndC [Acidobacterium]|uniref:Putative sulfurtransferase DndC n=1 Tax=Acidobacterium capsulatum (strain ATCC 51196 / DSM 11244 / BCRC 80197 / JCM 7670 / NBRC 15755 / NCIMB 13165 / 161) TaxID=240015 RepID=C1F5K5_ACIC5|nr:MULTISPECIES: DNA phosphorothioation system sulfurtransferase DndC [Acidobacterium]ACO31707.1 putative sulfurtransferase DndC [Acidobacterium capsulatum ATCC 51196]HCT61209.1 DNA phosphorothioation system sulfurtransferase DndC [Acidobacterium sp.]